MIDGLTASWTDHLTFEGGGEGDRSSTIKQGRKSMRNKPYIMHRFSTGKITALFIQWGKNLALAICSKRPTPSNNANVYSKA